MLFEELIPLDCLDLPSWIVANLMQSRYCTVGETKYFRQNSTISLPELWEKIDPQVLNALYIWRDYNEDLSQVAVPAASVSSLPPLTVMNFIDERTIAHDYTVRFKLAKAEIVDDKNLGDMRLPMKVAATLAAVGCRTIRDVIGLPYETLANYADDDAKLLLQTIDWFRKKSVISLDPELKPPFVTLEVPADLAPLVQLLYDDITMYGPLIEYEGIISDLLLIREAVAAKVAVLGFTEALLDDAELMGLVFSQPHFAAAATKQVASLVGQERWDGITHQEIDENLPLSMRSAGGSTRFVPQLLEQGVIEEFYRAFYPVLGDNGVSQLVRHFDYDKQFQEQVENLIYQGWSCAKVALKLGKPYALVRDVFDNRFLHEPKSYMDRYSYWIRSYKMTKREFCYIFNVGEEVFDYLRGVYRFNRKGLEEMAADERATEEIVARLNDVLKRRK